MRSILLTCAFVCMPIQAKATTSATEDCSIEKVSPWLIGQFNAVNKNLDLKTRQYVTKEYVFNTVLDLNGNGLKTDWFIKESQQWFGTAITTMNTDKGVQETLWFSDAARQLKVNTSSISTCDQPNKMVSLQAGKDLHGSFQAKRTIEKTKDGYRFIHERKYEQTPWFMIDSFVAVKTSDL